MGAGVTFQWKTPDFLLKNPDFLFRNPDFLLKNVDFTIKADTGRLLLEGAPGSGLDPHAANVAGQTAADLAEQSGFTALKQLIDDWEAPGGAIFRPFLGQFLSRVGLTPGVLQVQRPSRRRRIERKQRGRILRILRILRRSSRRSDSSTKRCVSMLLFHCFPLFSTVFHCFPHCFVLKMRGVIARPKQAGQGGRFAWEVLRIQYKCLVFPDFLLKMQKESKVAPEK